MNADKRRLSSMILHAFLAFFARLIVAAVGMFAGLLFTISIAVIWFGMDTATDSAAEWVPLLIIGIVIGLFLGTILNLIVEVAVRKTRHPRSSAFICGFKQVEP